MQMEILYPVCGLDLYFMYFKKSNIEERRETNIDTD